MDLIIYHRDCPDGFCAAFVAKKRYPEARLLGCTYGEAPPMDEVRWKDVLVVDFSWDRDTVIAMACSATSFEVLDHHKTAQQNLAGLDCATFDMNRSGAALAWDKLFSGPRPWYVDYVQDRDLWQWKLPNSKEISAYVMALPHTIEAWSELDTITAEDAARLGVGVRKQVEHYIEKIAAQAREGNFWDFKTAVVNAPYTNISDVLNRLCEQGYDVGLGWFERKDGRVQFSLRSIGDTDVSLIAKNYGGGGHKNAAGFELPLAEGRALVDSVLGRNTSFDWGALQKLRSADNKGLY